MREEKRERGESKASFQDLWSSIGQFSSGQERKFIASMRGTYGYLERRISLKIQERKFRDIEFFGFRKLPTRVSMFQEVRDSSYLGLLPIFGKGKEGFSFKGLFDEEKLDFRVLLDVTSPRRIA